MRSFLFVPSFLLVSWLSLTTTYGQTIPDSLAHSSAAGRSSYKFAFGIRQAVNGDSETSLSGKYFLTPRAALHLTAGRVIGPGRSAVSLSYERHHRFFTSARFRYLYGAGVSLVAIRSTRDSGVPNTWSTRLYGNALLGLEYTCKSWPLAVSADGRLLVRADEPTQRRRESVANIALSAHYLLGRR
jgi:hypothetical protein